MRDGLYWTGRDLVSVTETDQAEYDDLLDVEIPASQVPFIVISGGCGCCSYRDRRSVDETLDIIRRQITQLQDLENCIVGKYKRGVS